jgi:hypothetical protein
MNPFASSFDNDFPPPKKNQAQKFSAHSDSQFVPAYKELIDPA